MNLVRNKPGAGVVRYYGFNGPVGADPLTGPSDPADEYTITDGHARLGIKFSGHGIMSWDFARYFMRVVYWPQATTEEELDKLVIATLREAAGKYSNFFPTLNEYSLWVTPLDDVTNGPLTGIELEEAQQAAEFNPERFGPVGPKYAYMFNDHIVGLDGTGQYDLAAFGKLTGSWETSFGLIPGIIRARIARQQIEVTFTPEMDLQLGHDMVLAMMRSFFRATDDTVFPTLKKNGGELTLAFPK
jgi:hypothetical protein